MRRYRHLRRLGGAALALVALPLLALLVINIFLNTWLRLLVNQRPQRMRMAYTSATMTWPGDLEVHGLSIRHQGPRDQWLLSVDHATLHLDIAQLLERRVYLTEPRASGASFRWRPRFDAPTAPTQSAAPAGTQAGLVRSGEFQPPIPGLQNPPDPAPEDLYPPPAQWKVVVEDLRLDDIGELWLADYRYVGSASLDASFTVEAQSWLAVDHAGLSLDGGTLQRGDAPILRDIRGEVDLALVGADPRVKPALDLFGGLSGRVVVQAEVSDLAFIEYYLPAASWLHFSGGTGALAMDLQARDGRFVVGSTLVAEVSDFVVQYLSYTGLGDGVVHLSVGEASGAPVSRIAVDLLEFAVTGAGSEVPHMKGQGLHIVATSPDVAFDRPFTELSVTIDLPKAIIPDARIYSRYLPDNIGLTIESGSGTLQAHVEATIPGNQCSGELTLEATGLRASLDGLALDGDLSIHAAVPSGDLGTGHYAIAKSTLRLANLNVRTDPDARSGQRDTTGWWARVNLAEGEIRAGAPTFLRGSLTGDFRDTTPFLTVFAEKRSLPRWVHGVFGLSPVRGTAEIELGTDRVAVSAVEVKAGNYLVLLDLERRNTTRGRLFAKLGPLSIGLTLAEDGREVHLFNARRWYDSQGH